MIFTPEAATALTQREPPLHVREGDCECFAHARDDLELVGAALDEALQTAQRAEAVVPVVDPDLAMASLLSQLPLDLRNRAHDHRIEATCTLRRGAALDDGGADRLHREGYAG